MNKLKIISIEKTVLNLFVLIEEESEIPPYFISKSGKNLILSNHPEFKGYDDFSQRVNLLLTLSEEIRHNDKYSPPNLTNQIIEDLLGDATKIINDQLKGNSLNMPSNISDSQIKKTYENKDFFRSLNLYYVCKMNPNYLLDKLTYQMKCAAFVLFWDRIFYSLEKCDNDKLIHIWGDLNFIKAFLIPADSYAKKIARYKNAKEISKRPRKPVAGREHFPSIKAQIKEFVESNNLGLEDTNVIKEKIFSETDILNYLRDDKNNYVVDEKGNKVECRLPDDSNLRKWINDIKKV